MIAGPSALYAFDFKAVPLKAEIQPLLGFISAACDVFAHDLGGEPAGPGSINATLRAYQSLFDEQHTEVLIESTFELYRERPEAFEAGRKMGDSFAGALLRRDTDIPARIMVHLLSEQYRKYCGNPDGIEKG